MKESIGGTWLLGIAALFLVLFSAFIAYSINYTKAFRAKNEILNLIEQNEGYTPYQGNSYIENASDETLDASTQGQIYKLIKSIGYDYGSESVKCNDDGYIGRSEPGGYCIYKFVSNETVRYKVTTYVIMKFPVINFGIQVPIKGETKTMYYDVAKSIDVSKKIK